MTKRTFEPWDIGLDSDELSVQVITEDGWHICYVELDPCDEIAHLIAAAPELLEALEGLAAYYGKAHSIPEWDLARTAIAKARGEDDNG